jgi:hypothetical protein
MPEKEERLSVSYSRIKEIIREINFRLTQAKEQALQSVMTTDEENKKQCEITAINAKNKADHYSNVLRVLDLPGSIEALDNAIEMKRIAMELSKEKE